MNRTYHNNMSVTHPLVTTNPHDCVPFLEMKIFRAPPIGDVENMPSPRLLAMHIPYTLLPESVVSSGCRIVYICRNPKDVFVSMWHFMAKLTTKELSCSPLSLEEAFDLFCKGISGYGPFWDHVQEYWKASLKCPETVLFLKYEDMKSETLFHVKRLAEFLGQPFSLEEESKGVVQEIVELCSFENLSDLEVNKNGAADVSAKNDVFFRKGKVGDWKNYLTTQMTECLDQITEEKLGGLF
ncbi:Cytosolic sulfotransferase 15 [Camellia lanceoleosa]|uniref:Cytosolic sulfotransferase 15 n=1 Tax=Camellia lanceoleosa TaxID=1840588 RepID=A0ACC0HDJ6_9ERIC|nr:Cytosolic sulfotransferase 15 [Camellia lanceoleosa]